MEIEKIVTSLGGPLVMIGPSLVGLWRGIGGSSQVQITSQTDYDRACSVSNYLDLLSVGTASAIILGDMPMPTSFYSKNSRDPVVYRYMYVPEEFDHRHIPTLYDSSMLAEIESCLFQSKDDSLLIFDATIDAETDQPDGLPVPIRPGLYTIKTYHYLDDTTSIILHDFNLID